MRPSDTIAPLPHHLYHSQVLYHAMGGFGGGSPVLRAWEFNGWQAESMSWKTSCYIHAGLSGPVIRVMGPGAKNYLESLCLNSFAKFPIGTMKHAVMCNEHGLIAAHGIIERQSEEMFDAFAGAPPGMGRGHVVPSDVEINYIRRYLFQIAGPKSLQLLEKVTGESLSDIRFLHFRDSRINGLKTEVARIGMSGNLAYELHGPYDEGPAIYDAVFKAGEQFGLERLGWGTYLVNHVEGGFPQHTWTFRNAQPQAGLPDLRLPFQVSGSVDPANTRARNRTPVEVRWENMAKFDHDFIGRPALQGEMAAPKRKTLMLRWNPQDVMDIYASLLRPGDAYKPLDLPYAPQRWPMAHADHILKDGRPIGYSSGTTYSYYFREVLSMGCLDLEASEIGTEVIVQWGDYGKTIKNVRATVARFPYLTEGRNSALDAAVVAGRT
jgi:glycine cleavage system aminomethyltransferase T